MNLIKVKRLTVKKRCAAKGEKKKTVKSLLIRLVTWLMMWQRPLFKFVKSCCGSVTNSIKAQQQPMARSENRIYGKLLLLLLLFN